MGRILDRDMAERHLEYPARLLLLLPFALALVPWALDVAAFFNPRLAHLPGARGAWMAVPLVSSLLFALIAPLAAIVLSVTMRSKSISLLKFIGVTLLVSLPLLLQSTIVVPVTFYLFHAGIIGKQTTPGVAFSILCVFTATLIYALSAALLYPLARRSIALTIAGGAVLFAFLAYPVVQVLARLNL